MEGATNPFRHFVDFNVQEIQVLIEVLVFEQAFPDHLGTEKQNVASFTSPPLKLQAPTIPVFLRKI